MSVTVSPLIAVVDDDQTIREAVGAALRQNGFRTRLFRDGREAWESMKGELPDLAILDILMPGMDGLDLCRNLRTLSREVPIVFLTSRDEEFDRVLGLEIGGDDYLCKPFSVRELVARVRVLFRRMSLAHVEPEAEQIVERGPLRLDLQRHTASWRGEPVALTVTEFRMLLALARNPGHVKTREQLMQEGYPHDAYVSERTVDTHIKRMRAKLEAADPSFEGIATVYGLGYRLAL